MVLAWFADNFGRLWSVWSLHAAAWLGFHNYGSSFCCELLTVKKGKWDKWRLCLLSIHPLPLLHLKKCGISFYCCSLVLSTWQWWGHCLRKAWQHQSQAGVPLNAGQVSAGRGEIAALCFSLQHPFPSCVYEIMDGLIFTCCWLDNLIMQCQRTFLPHLYI